MSDKEEGKVGDIPAAPQVVSLYEKHKRIYVRQVKGLWDTWRWIFVWLTQFIFYGAIWFNWNDRQAVLFHLVERKFYLFGLVLWPQDVFYLALLLIISAYALFLFTAVAGRLFCGYACPQTVYTELFMWIEYKLEGDRPAQVKLDKASWDAKKWAIKISKHVLWLLLSLWTGFTLVGYFTPVAELLESAKTFAFGPWELFGIFFYAGFCYMQAGFLREQVCKYMCPYARFQAVMFDPDTLVITYDAERGEPRGAKRKNVEPGSLGDCVDCGICVQVCPTGIDIRKGLQYECVGCGACIDGCDEVMSKIGLPTGLIRYTSENALVKHYDKKSLLKHIFRPRIVLYTAILVLICAASAWSLAARIPLKADVIRDRSMLAREADDGRIENVYTIKIMNTEEQAKRFALSVEGLKGLEVVTERFVDVEPVSNHEFTVSVRAEGDSGNKGANTIYFGIKDVNNEKVAVREKASFMLP